MSTDLQRPPVFLYRDRTGKSWILEGRPYEPSESEPEPSDFVATTRLSRGGEHFDAGARLPKGPLFGGQYINIRVHRARGLDFDRLAERGLAKRQKAKAATK